MPEIVLLLLLVPTITALIGWGTNLAAVKMIFHPTKFVGVGPFGWQAILYKQGEKFASGVADMVTGNLISARELAERLDPDEIERLFADTLDKETRSICREAADRIQEGSWDTLPDHVREMIAAQVKTETRKLVRELFNKLQGVSDELLDLHQLVTQQLGGDNVDRLARLTKKIGAAEFKFIEIYGGVFGFIIGLFQVGVWSLMQTWWLMPIAGLMVGLVTNWLAIQMIFKPQEPKKFFGVLTYQGLFPKRQAAIAKDYGETAAAEILTPATVIRLVTEGEAGEKIARLVTETIHTKLESEWKKLEAMLPLELSPEVLADVEQIVIRRITESVPQLQPELEPYLERKLDIANTVETRLAQMPKDDFERVLRGIFEEDELTLILVGGALGAAVGAIQGALVLAIG